jgi:ribosomal protein S18 acetylase RimI-like enzyme
MAASELARECLIRAPERRELGAVAALAGALVRQHHAFDPERFFLLEPVERGYERYLASQLGRRETVMLAAFAGEQVVGYAYGSLQPRDWVRLLDPCGELHDLFVAEAARRQGLATRLVEETLQRFDALGAPRVVLSAAWRNPAAQQFFERLGFRRTMVEMALERGPRRG